MAGVIVHTTLGNLRVPVGSSRSIGRAGEIVLVDAHGGTVGWLHAEAFTLTVEADHWIVTVPDGKRYEVTVRDDDSGASRIVGVGTATRFSWRMATLSLVAAGIELRLRVNASTLARLSYPAGTTADPAFVLDAEDLHDRVWIAACRDRVVHPGAPAVPWPEVARVLSAAGRWEDLDVTDAAVRQRAQWRRPSLEGHMEASGLAGMLSADLIVDFLVRTGSVTRIELEAVLVGIAK